MDKIPWEKFPKGTHVMRAVLIPEDPDSGGGYTAIAVNLPGCASQGDTVDEALANLEEAFVLLLESYEDVGEPVPWFPTAGAILRNVVVTRKLGGPSDE